MFIAKRFSTTIFAFWMSVFMAFIMSTAFFNWLVSKNTIVTINGTVMYISTYISTILNPVNLLSLTNIY